MISSSVIKFLLIPGIHPSGGGGRWVDGCQGVYGCGGRCLMHTHMLTHAHTCMHACTCMLNMINMDASMSAAICNFYTCIHVCVCMCMHVCVCGTPPMSPNAPRHPPPTYPIPRAAGSPKDQNSISLELIEIFRFCLKILYLWTVLNSYRL